MCNYFPVVIPITQQVADQMLGCAVQNLGTDWDERVLPSIGNEIVKAVVARYNAEQLLTQRDKVSKAVRVSLSGSQSSCLMSE